jgi:hypothetical protein
MATPPKSYAREWRAFVAEALAIRETVEERDRRLRHLRRDLEADVTLDWCEAEPLISQLDAELATHATAA